MIASTLSYLLAGLGKMDKLSGKVENICGIPLTITTDQRSATPPCLLVTPDGGSYSINGGSGEGSFSIDLILPLFDDPVSAALELADIIGKDLYSKAGRGSDGCRVMGVSVVGLVESEEPAQSGIWILTMKIDVKF